MKISIFLAKVAIAAVMISISMMIFDYKPDVALGVTLDVILLCAGFGCGIHAWYKYGPSFAIVIFIFSAYMTVNRYSYWSQQISLAVGAAS